jgi:hypothetical protein
MSGREHRVWGTLLRRSNREHYPEVVLGKYYDQSIVPAELRRKFDVYERIRKIGLDLGTFEKNVTSLKGRNIAGCVIHESGLVYMSGVGMGSKPMNDDPERVKHGQEAGRDAADHHIRTLHWALTCGGEGGDLNDVLYTVKALGMVVSTDVEFHSGPAVVNGFSGRWQSVFGGAYGELAKDGLDASYSGVHARSAIGGFTGRFSQEPEIIVAIPPPLARAIIENRGWIFPLLPDVYDRVVKSYKPAAPSTSGRGARPRGGQAAPARPVRRTRASRRVAHR